MRYTSSHFTYVLTYLLSNVAPSTAVCVVIRSRGASNTSFIAWRPSLCACWTTCMEQFTWVHHWLLVTSHLQEISQDFKGMNQTVKAAAPLMGCEKFLQELWRVRPWTQAYHTVGDSHGNSRENSRENVHGGDSGLNRVFIQTRIPKRILVWEAMRPPSNIPVWQFSWEWVGPCKKNPCSSYR